MYTAKVKLVLSSFPSCHSFTELKLLILREGTFAQRLSSHPEKCSPRSNPDFK